MFFSEDAKNNFMREMPLAIKIERFQRQLLMQGLKPVRDATQKQSIRYLESLKFIQKFETDVDEFTMLLRKRDKE